MRHTWAERIAAQGPKDDSFQWVVENAQGEFVGSITSHHCDRRTGTFEYGVAIKSEHQRKGYAAEAIKLALSSIHRQNEKLIETSV